MATESHSARLRRTSPRVTNTFISNGRKQSLKINAGRVKVFYAKSLRVFYAGFKTDGNSGEVRRGPCCASRRIDFVAAEVTRLKLRIFPEPPHVGCYITTKFPTTDCASAPSRVAGVLPPCVRGFSLFRPDPRLPARRRISFQWIRKPRLFCPARTFGNRSQRIGFSWLIQFQDRFSGIWERSLFFQPPLLFTMVCQSFSGAVSKMSSSDAGNVSHDLRFISISSWPGDQPA